VANGISKFALVTAHERGCARAAFEAMSDASPDLQLRSIFEEGNVVDRMSQNSIFSGGTTVRNVRGEEASGATSALMADLSVGRINQATFVTPNGETTKLDSIERSGDKWDHDEVKSSLSAKDKHVFDALVSTDRARRAGLGVGEVRLVHLDSDWRLGEPEADLFQVTDITERIEDPAMVGFLSDTYKALEKGTAPAASLVPGCWQCQYFSSCFGETRNPITELSRLGKARIAALSQLGVVDIRDIPAGFNLTDKQRAAADFAINSQAHVNEDSLAKALAGISEPVRHLDFEWVGFAVPVHEGVAPWEPVATQYSIHLETEEGLEHTDHLSEAEGDGRRELAESLIDALGDEGSIIVYHASAERSRIRDMARWFPDLEESLNSIADRLFDLLPVVRKNVLNPDFHGSTSLKVVAPILVPGFGYDDLDIAGGGDAQGAMNLMMRGKIAAEEVPAMRERLLRYCERDTEATAGILQALRVIGLPESP